MLPSADSALTPDSSRVPRRDSGFGILNPDRIGFSYESGRAQQLAEAHVSSHHGGVLFPVVRRFEKRCALIHPGGISS
jgi:hypothetical protein